MVEDLGTVSFHLTAKNTFCIFLKSSGVTYATILTWLDHDVQELRLESVIPEQDYVQLKRR